MNSEQLKNFLIENSISKDARSWKSCTKQHWVLNEKAFKYVNQLNYPAPSNFLWMQKN